MPVGDVVDLRRAGADALAGVRDFAFIAARTRFTLVRRHDQCYGPPPAFGHHMLQRLVQVRRPAAQPDVRWQRRAVCAQLGCERACLTECQFVEGRLPADEFVMMHHGLDARRHDRTPAQHVRQKRPDLAHRGRSTEPDEQDGVVGACDRRAQQPPRRKACIWHFAYRLHVWIRRSAKCVCIAHLLLSSCTMSIRAMT